MLLPFDMDYMLCLCADDLPLAESLSEPKLFLTCQTFLLLS